MKKLYAILVLLCLSISVTACQAAGNSQASSTPASLEIPVETSTAPQDSVPPTSSSVPPTTEVTVNFYPFIGCGFPRTTEEVIEDTDFICTARVTDITFFVYDNYELGTLIQEPRYGIGATFELEILHTYSGELSGTVTYSEYGAIPDRFLDEQAALIKEYDIPYVYYSEHRMYPELNETYLFMLELDETGLGLGSDTQSIFEINEDEVVEDPTVASYKSILDYLANVEQGDGPQ